MEHLTAEQVSRNVAAFLIQQEDAQEAWAILLAALAGYAAEHIGEQHAAFLLRAAADLCGADQLRMVN